MHCSHVMDIEKNFQEHGISTRRFELKTLRRYTDTYLSSILTSSIIKEISLPKRFTSNMFKMKP